MLNVAVADGVGLLELDRPDRRNALDAAQCARIVEGVARVLDEGARVLVVTGAGTSFCAGADFSQVYEDGFRDVVYTALDALTGAPVPCIAAVNGPAIGAGTQLALACDIRVGVPDAVFGIPTARLGVAVDPWTVRRVAQIAGGATARSMLLACRRIPADLALARGLLDVIGDRDDALALAAEMATLAPLTLRYNKLAADRAVDDPLVTAAYEACWASEDRVEAKRAMAERRSPVFTGR